MTSIGPGRHPQFDITVYSVEHQRVLRRLEQLFHLTRHGSKSVSTSSTYQYALVLPTSFVRSLLHTDREILVVFSPYKDFQARTIDAFDQIIADLDEYRVEKVVRILISDDASVSEKLRGLFQGRPDAPVIIPFYYAEIGLRATDEFIFQRFREFTFSRDLFSMSSPLRSDLYFFGRSQLINEICSKLAAGENFGLFGLRRSGKTSIVHGVQRALSSRNGAGIFIDCSSPAVHQRRWNELLHYIVRVFRDTYSIEANFQKESSYTEIDAPDIFVREMRTVKGRLRKDFIAVLFDEIERISFGTASSPHWNEDRDFLHFWQAIRAGFQQTNSPYSFLIVGTNPSAIEKTKIYESDNPLFGNVEKRFMPMFESTQVSEMVSSLGAIMGLEFDEASMARLFDDFGGHPFLTRYACSYIAKDMPKRPLKVDRTVYSAGVQNFRVEAGEYVKSVVDMLKSAYPDEYEMMKYLAVKRYDDFVDLASNYPSMVEHLKGYGIVREGQKSHYFSIGVVEGYFESEARPVTTLDAAGRQAEISEKRNRLERQLRILIRQVFSVSFTPKKRVDELLRYVPSERHEGLRQAGEARLFSEGDSPLYLKDVGAVISGHWGIFQNIIDMPKSEFHYHMDVVNKLRKDAHGNDISDHELEKVRISFRELERTSSGL